MARCAGVTGRVVQVDDDDDEKLVSLEKKQIQLVGTKITLSWKRERWKIQLTQKCLHVIDGGIGDYCTTQEPRSHAARLYRCFDRVQEMFSFLTVLQFVTTTLRIVSVYILAGCNIDRLHRKVVALT